MCCFHNNEDNSIFLYKLISQLKINCRFTWDLKIYTQFKRVKILFILSFFSIFIYKLRLPLPFRLLSQLINKRMGVLKVKF